MIHLSTNDYNNIIKKYNEGRLTNRREKIFYKNWEGTLKEGICKLYTREEISEIIKCSNDPIYFIETYLSIKLYEYQKEIIKAYLKNKFVCHALSHQCGITTIKSALYLWMLVFRSEYNILYIDYYGDAVDEMLAKIFKLYLKLPFFIKPGLCAKNSKNIVFDNMSYIKGMSQKREFAIGYSPNMIDLSSISNMHTTILDNMLKTIIPTIGARVDDRLIISSVPKGHNIFHKLLIDAERKPGDPLKNSFFPMRTYWWEVPGRDENWIKETMKNIGISSKLLFNEYYDIAFVTISDYNREQ